MQENEEAALAPARHGLESDLLGGRIGADTTAADLTPQGAATQAGAAPELRAYQIKVIADIDAEVARGNKRVLVVLPTGAGKTVVAAAIINKEVAIRHHVLFLAHRIELIRQASKKLLAVGVDHGILQAGFPTRPGERVQVASISTIYARCIRTRTVEMPAADLVIVDEAHHVVARTYQKILERYPNAVVIGLTATPCRGDGRGLGHV